ncbi:hypothetical protein A8950_0713 [Dongia mobilis]|uniref:DUF2125 domain-containing protein n=1 Tax=Dongia mobilis TaxID=578943 RepID=A0A4R6WRE6_9PROT|nr:DUF2125 domain-containing protein [Dongia mobilis]TDQ84165.1 hypothetical protein A8950_0713 [Dongia mobilis]
MKRRRKLLVAALVLLVLLAGGYVAYWRYMAGVLEQGIADWAENERATGRDVVFDDAAIAGFPFAFRRDFANVLLRQPVADGIWSVSTATVTATMRPWQWRVIEFQATAPVTATLSVPGKPPETVSLAEAKGQVMLLADGRLERIAIQAGGVSLVSDAQIYTAQRANLAATFPPLMARAHTDPLLGVEMDLAGITLPEGMRALTAEPIASLGLAATILGPVPLDLPPRQAIARWAENGGTLELTRFAFVQAPLDLAGEGTLALDRNLQVLGALTIRAAGLPETIDLLAAEGLISGPAVATGRMMAENLAKPDDKGRRVASAALSLQQGFIWLGPIRLAPLPVFTWQ